MSLTENFQQRACSFGWLLVAGIYLFREKRDGGWLLVVGLF
jgi:hypothetical protein